MHSIYKMISFNVKNGSCGGALVQYQEGDCEENVLPFQIGKVLITSGMKLDDVRGNHAHFETEEIVVAISGGCLFELDDGKGKKQQVQLCSKSKQMSMNKNEESKEALLLYPHVWRTFRNFEPGTILLIIANMKYDETDYIRDWEEFKSQASNWQTLGGSSL